MNLIALDFIAMASPGGAGGEQSSVLFFGYLALMMGVFYILLIRPQQRKEKERKKLISEIKSGDRVMFAGGLMGDVANVKEHTFIIRIAEKVKVEVARGGVTQVLDKDDAPDEEAVKQTS